LDILFVQEFKSHGSLYFLCVHGHGEDGATILRRMLEIAFQTEYLCNDPFERENRAERYLAWFWLQADSRLKSGIPEPGRTWWQHKYNTHKHLILGADGRPLRNWWGNKSIRELANDLGLLKTYDHDYRFLSQMAHCTAQGILMSRVGNTVEIRTDILVREILVFGTRYMIKVTKHWNDTFRFIEASRLEELACKAVRFNFGATSP
jgi:hypothetical protein